MRRDIEQPGPLSSDVVVHRGVLKNTGSITRYFTSQPAVTQWVAVGVETPLKKAGDSRVIVGSGRTEDEAISSLRSRLLSEPRPRQQVLPLLADHDASIEIEEYGD